MQKAVIFATYLPRPGSCGQGAISKANEQHLAVPREAGGFLLQLDLVPKVDVCPTQVFCHRHARQQCLLADIDAIDVQEALGSLQVGETVGAT